MGIILRLPNNVSDPTDRLPVNTPLGLTSAQVGNYYYDMKEAGYDLDLTQFNALTAFWAAIKAAGEEDNLIEVYPFIGTTFAQACIKFKGGVADQALVAVNGTDLTDFEVSSGEILGFDDRTYAGSSSRMLDPGVTGSDLSSGIGVLAYIDTSTMTFGLTGSANDRVLAGASLDATASRQLIIGYRYNDDLGNGYSRYSYRYTAATTFHQLSNPNVSGVFHSFATPDPENAETWIDGSLEGGPSAYTEDTTSLARPIYIMGKSPFSGSVNTGFNGKCRFLALTNGQETQGAAIATALTTLMAALGRTF